MRKRNIAVLLLTALLLTGLTGCVQRGDTSGVEIVTGREIGSVDEVKTDYDYVVLALGASTPGVLRLEKGEAMNALEFLAQFKATDGNLDLGENVVVIGGGNTAVQDAIYLSKICSKVYLIHRRSEFRAEKHVADGLAACANIEPVLNSTVARFIGEGKLSGIVVKNRETGEERELSVSGAFIAVGFAPNNGVFAELVKLDESGFIRSGEDCKTSRPEIFAAGDCRTKSVRQLVTAGADGGVAAIAACEYIDSMQNAEKAAES